MLWRKSNWLQVNSKVTVRLAGYRAVCQTWCKGFAWSLLLHQLYQVALGLAKACLLYMSVALIHTSGGCQLWGLTGAQGHSLVLAVICGSDSPRDLAPRAGWAILSLAWTCFSVFEYMGSLSSHQKCSHACAGLCVYLVEEITLSHRLL